MSTQIRGAQIVDAIAGSALTMTSGVLDVNYDDSTIGVTGENLKVKDGGITGTQLNASVAGDGLTGGGGSALAVNVDDSTVEISTDTLQVKNGGITGTQLNASVAGDGLSGGGGSALSVSVDDSTIETSGDSLQLKDSGVTEAKLNMSNGPTNGYYIKYVTDHMEWAEAATPSGINETSIKFEDESSNCDGEATEFTLSSSPITNSVQVYLNGLMQQEGAGKDYTLADTTVTFATAPLADDILLIHYIAD